MIKQNLLKLEKLWNVHGDIMISAIQEIPWSVYSFTSVSLIIYHDYIFNLKLPDDFRGYVVLHNHLELEESYLHWRGLCLNRWFSEVSNNIKTSGLKSKLSEL